jgi:hypothetical protein
MFLHNDVQTWLRRIAQSQCNYITRDSVGYVELVKWVVT